eukprot:9195700-Pyramimonas_sp.AAC.1
MMQLRVFRAISALKMTVAVGLVTGATPMMMPTGSATLVSPLWWSDQMGPVSCNTPSLVSAKSPTTSLGC